MSLFLASSTHAHPHAHAHTHTMQFVLQPENLFKHFPEGLGIETGDEELKAESKWVTAAHYCGRVKSWAVKPAHAFVLMASPGRLLFLCSILSFSWWLNTGAVNKKSCRVMQKKYAGSNVTSGQHWEKGGLIREGLANHYLWWSWKQRKYQAPLYGDKPVMFLINALSCFKVQEILQLNLTGIHNC